MHEWQARWTTVDVGSSLWEALPTISKVWRTSDTELGGRLDITFATRFLTRHCHLGRFNVPWDPPEWAPCLLCGEDFSRAHLVWECTGCIHQRDCVLGGVVAERVGDWTWLVETRGSRLGRFIHNVMDVVESAQEVQEAE